MNTQSFRSLLKLWGWAMLVWGVLSVALSLQISHDSSIAWAQSFQRVASYWLPWPFLMPGFYFLTRLKPIEKGAGPKVIMLHVFAAAAALLIATMSYSMLSPADPIGPHNDHVHPDRHPHDPHGPGHRKFTMPPEMPDKGFPKPPAERPHEKRPGHEDETRRRLFFSIHNAIVLIAIMASCHAIHFYLTTKEQEHRAVELNASLTETRLQSLSMQLQPHFLFNSLNTIASLMHENVERADAMIVALSSFLRSTLNLPRSQELSLTQELELSRHYLAIESMRLEDRLQTEEQITPEAAKALVPVLLLQPLVENAFRHGFRHMTGNCFLRFKAERCGENLRILIQDNGPGLKPDFVEGTGISNARARLEALFGNKASLKLHSDSGCTVEIQLPFRTA